MNRRPRANRSRLLRSARGSELRYVEKPAHVSCRFRLPFPSLLRPQLGTDQLPAVQRRRRGAGPANPRPAQPDALFAGPLPLLRHGLPESAPGPELHRPVLPRGVRTLPSPEQTADRLVGPDQPVSGAAGPVAALRLSAAGGRRAGEDAGHPGRALVWSGSPFPDGPAVSGRGPDARLRLRIGLLCGPDARARLDGDRHGLQSPRGRASTQAAWSGGAGGHPAASGGPAREL